MLLYYLTVLNAPLPPGERGGVRWRGAARLPSPGRSLGAEQDQEAGEAHQEEALMWPGHISPCDINNVINYLGFHPEFSVSRLH